MTLRVGGAIDVRDARGLTEGREVLRARGRWAGDIGWIYAHQLAREQFGVSLDMARASGPTLQEAAPRPTAHSTRIPQFS